MNRLLIPPVIEHLRDRISALAPDPVEEWDRRGYPLIHWPSSVSETKPNELSCELEVLLAPASYKSVGRLITALHANEACPSWRLWPDWPDELPRWRLRRFDRDAGPQSVDVYFDLPDNALTEEGYTLRVRSLGSAFMTWAASEGESVRAINAELPAARLGVAEGLVARLELNWLARIGQPVGEAPEGMPLNGSAAGDPLAILSKLSGERLNHATPLSIHRTVRSKFAFVERTDEGDDRDRIILNIDFIAATSCRSGRSVTWVDVDISSVLRIDAPELSLLVAMTNYLVTNYALRERVITKPQRFIEACI